jgi:AcrR family transcriptional regulator
MSKTPRLSLRDFERETEKFMSPTSEKEKAIMEAASALLGERGIDGATTAEIAKRAGVTERTLFRYFPSKDDLIRRVLFPPLLTAGFSREFEKLEALLKMQDPDLKSWYTAFTTQRYAAISKNPALVRTVLLELAQNNELRDAVAAIWRQHIWRPMIDRLREWQKEGAIRKEIDVEVLARAIHCLNVGYFFVRYVFEPNQNWDDAHEIDMMAEILTRGACGESAHKPSRKARSR